MTWLDQERHVRCQSAAESAQRAQEWRAATSSHMPSKALHCLDIEAVLIAGGFGTSQLLKERSGLAPGEEIQVSPQENEELKKELVLKAAAVRDIMGLASERGIALREVLKGGVLSGQPVYFKSRHGPILNKGEVCHLFKCAHEASDIAACSHVTCACLSSKVGAQVQDCTLTEAMHLTDGSLV